MRAPTAAVATFLHALLLVACAGGPGGRRLSFAQMQSLNPGVSGEWILDEYPFAGRVDRRPDGTLRSMRYPVEDPLGRGQSVELEFDERGVLSEKRYSGPYVRPPKDPKAVPPPETR
jgi:hypothetical protein